jgi:hypothetical protein
LIRLNEEEMNWASKQDQRFDEEISREYYTIKINKCTGNRWKSQKFTCKCR